MWLFEIDRRVIQEDGLYVYNMHIIVEPRVVPGTEQKNSTSPFLTWML
jgi:hypothetical protein